MAAGLARPAWHPARPAWNRRAAGLRRGGDRGALRDARQRALRAARQALPVRRAAARPGAGEMSRMPALFVGHGSPMNALGDNEWTRAWRALGESLPRPRVILAISAHWYIEGTAVTAMPNPRTIHDFGGFPRALHEVHYPAAGDPGFAADLKTLLA